VLLFTVEELEELLELEDCELVLLFIVEELELEDWDEVLLFTVELEELLLEVNSSVELLEEIGGGHSM
jgi:hypothetical protein